MWKQLLSIFKESSLCQEAFDEALLMLRASHGMHRDSVSALHGGGILVADIYERDREVNKYERDVRRKILTHLSISPKADINSALVLTAIVIDIERIGDYTKNIIELAAGLPESFDGGELNEEVLDLERIVDKMFEDLHPALVESDEELARGILRSHKSISGRVERGLQLLRSDKVLKGQSGKAVTAALYLRYLKRVSAHLKNVATSVINPFHRIGYREKKKDRAIPSLEGLEEAGELEDLEGDESRD